MTIILKRPPVPVCPLLLLLLCLFPPSSLAAEQTDCAPRTLQTDLEPLLARTRLALNAQQWQTGQSLLADLRDYLPCTQAPVPASLLARFFLYQALSAWQQQNLDLSRQQLDRALAVFPELEWDSELADPRTVRPLLTELETRRVRLLREAPAQLIVQAVGSDQKLYVNGTPYPRSTEPVPLRAGEHLLQRLQSAENWQGDWQLIAPGETYTLDQKRFPSGAPRTWLALGLHLEHRQTPGFESASLTQAQGVSIAGGLLTDNHHRVLLSLGVSYREKTSLSAVEEQRLGGPCPLTYRSGLEYLHRVQAGGIFVGGGAGVLLGCLDWKTSTEIKPSASRSSTASGITLGRALGLTPEAVWVWAWLPENSDEAGGRKLGLRLEVAGGMTFSNAPELDTLPLSFRVNLGMWLAVDAPK